MRKSSEIAREIKAECARKCLKQKELSEKTGISRSTFGAWARDEKKITNESLQRVAEVLGVSVEYLRGEPERLTPEQGEMVTALVEAIGRLQGILQRVVQDPEYARTVKAEADKRETRLQGFESLLQDESDADDPRA